MISNSGKWLFVAGPFLAVVLISGCGQILSNELFNPNFLVDLGAKQGPEQQATPSNEALLLVRVTNQTAFPVTIKTQLVRPDEGEIAGPSFDFLDIGQTVGELLERCDEDPVQIVRINPLVTQQVAGTPVEIPEAYIWVNGFPVPPTSVPRPLIIGQDYQCGDTIEYVVQSLPEDRNRFRVVVLIYKSPI